MKNKLFLLLAACCIALNLQAQVQRPKLVVGLVVDQMRWDYLYFYNDEFCEGGFKRLLAEGYSCENTMINYVPTVTAIGHTSIYTGTTPALHGIAGNNFYQDGKTFYCCGDETVKPVGSKGKAGLMSPRNMLATTIGDQLRLATNFSSRVFGVALKDRAAILPAGHSANAAYWYDKEAGHFITSTYYMNQLPQWLNQFNQQNKTNEDIRATDQGVTLTFKLAEALIQNEQLGQQPQTDMLCVSISSTDMIGHATGTRGKENRSVYLQLDRDLAHFLQVLDQQVGPGNYLLFLSADHGAVHNPNYLKQHHLPGAGFPAWEAAKELNKTLAKKYQIKGNIILGTGSNSLYLDHKLLDKNNLQRQQVISDIRNLLMPDPRIAYVVDRQNVATQSIPQLLRERIINGTHPKRSGDILIITTPGVVPGSDKPDYIGTSHGAWNPYDAHIPLIFYGWHIQHGATAATNHIVDIAPTICAMLHIQQPNACIGQAITTVFEQ